MIGNCENIYVIEAAQAGWSPDHEPEEYLQLLETIKMVLYPTYIRK